MQKAVRANNGKEARKGMMAATNLGPEDQVQKEFQEWNGQEVLNGAKAEANQG